MRLIFSKDRPAQLDLLLRSLRTNTAHEATKVIWSATTRESGAGYSLLPLDRSMTNLFDLELRRVLMECPDPTVTFFCDDDIVFQRVAPPNLLECRGTFSHEVLCFSLRLGYENKQMPWPGKIWDWTEMPRTDFGYPGSIDGHTFRVDDVLWMIEDRRIPNPTYLEAVMAERCDLLAQQRPLMACHEQQSVVGVPVNRVSESSGCPFGETHPQSAEAINKRWLNGERICLDVLDFSGVVGCHHEIKFEWEDRP
jgi:hypothetical protein